MPVHGNPAGREREARTCEQHVLYRAGFGDDAGTDDRRGIVRMAGYRVVLPGADGDDAAGGSGVYSGGEKNEKKIGDGIRFLML